MTASSQQPENVRIGAWLLDPQLNQLSGPDRSVHLEPRAAAVLLELAGRAGQVCTRDALLDAVWGDAFVGEAALTHCIWELRKAFGDDAKNPAYIQTVPRRGYRLVADVAEPPRVAVLTLVAWTAGVDPAIATTLLAEMAGERVALEGDEDGEDEVLEDRDGAVFEQPSEAVRFALQLHKEVDVAARIPDSGTGIGIHLGEVRLVVAPATSSTPGCRVAVGLAAQIVGTLANAARSRQTLLSRAAFDTARAATVDLVPEGATLRWLAHGAYVAEEGEDSIEICEVGVDGFAPLEAPKGSSSVRPIGVENTIPGWRAAPGQTVPQRPHWTLVRKLGEGGFGEVWLTRHRKTGDRRVFKFCVEADRLRSLQREVTLFRLLKESLGSRRDIVRILDWNFDEAPYFLELEYIEGGSFADWAKAQDGLENVPLATRLEIVAQAGEALAGAHSIGVLHKDVKPGNILIASGREGTPRVLLTDFGIGRLADRGQLADRDITALGLTEIASLSSSSDSESGTRLYIAPELLEGRPASIPSDIYALGVVLYQAVVGQFDRAVGTGWRRHVDDPLLEEDIARCVDLDPERRPTSAREVAERLRSLETRRARREAERRHRDEAERTRLALERSRRRRKLLSIVAGASLAFAGVVTVLTLLAMGARDQAEQSRDRAERMVAFMLGDLRSTLEGVGRLDAMESTNEEVLRYFASIDAEEMTDEALARRGAALRQIGDVRLQSGTLDSAIAAFTEAARTAERLAQRHPNDGARRAELADSHFWLGVARRRQGDLEAALASFEAHRDMYQTLVEEDPSRQPWQLELVFGHGNVSAVLVELNRHDEALQAMQARLAIIGPLADGQPDDRALQLARASSHHRLGVVLQRQGDLEGALEHFHWDFDLLEPLAAAAADDTRTRFRLAVSAGYLGLVHWLRGELDAARAAYETESSIFDRLCALEPANAAWQRDRAIALSKLGRAQQAAGEVDAALATYRQAQNVLTGLIDHDADRADWRRDLAGRHRLIAGAHRDLGDTTRALESIEAARRLFEDLRAEGEDGERASVQRAQVDILRAEILHARGRGADAQRAWEAAMTAIEPIARDSEQPRHLDPMARALVGLGETARAQPILDRLRAQGYRAPDFMAYCQRFGVDC